MDRGVFGRALRVLAGLAVAAVVAGCGGGSDTKCVDGVGGSACQGGGSTPPSLAVANLSLNLSAATINNSGSDTLTATATATNANNQTLEGASIVLRVDSEAQIAVSGSATDANGKLSGEVGIGSNRDNRVVTVTALANNGALAVTKTFRVVGAAVSGTPVPAVIAPGASGAITFRLVDANSNPMGDEPIVIAGVGGAQVDGVTNANGEYVYNYVAPAAGGEISIGAEASGARTTASVLVQAAGGGSLPPVDATATPVRSASVSANPSVVPVNSEGTTNQAQIRVLFLTNNNAPIKNIRVRFDLAGDANSVGGSFTTGSNIVYTNDNGVATTSYVPAGRASPTDGVTIRACWDYVDFTTCNPARAVTTTLTVVADPVSVSIGTNDRIEIGSSGLTYVKRYIVQVVDSSGVAKPDVQVTPSVDLLDFYKGEWVPVSDGWDRLERAKCANEDLNRNNTNEIYADGWVEDANGSFNLTAGRPALEPRKADVAISFEGGTRTDERGTIVLRMEYPQNLASWVEFNLTVSASGVSATEGRANYTGTLPYLAAATQDPKAEPAFRYSPYGTEASPLLAKTYNGVTYQLCTNPN